MSTQEPHFTAEQREYISELRNTLRSEFAETERERTTVQELEDLKPDALMALKHTLRHSDNESIKAKVSMWTIDTLLDAQRVGDDPLAAFLKEMQGANHVTHTEITNPNPA
jgi:hypothetical protein